MSALKVDFFVIGVARGGTTSLYHYLQQHPDIFLPKVKECNFFSEVESMDESVYEDPKPGKEYHMKIIRSPKVYQSLYSEARLDQLKGEISPAYVWDAGSAQKILQHNPEARLIVSLRNPIERAFSHYLMHFQTGYEKAPTFEEALKAPKREIWGGGNQYLEMGLYFEQLKAYFDLFPPEHIKVLVSEEWTRNNGEALNEIYGFLGLGAISHQDLEATHNASVQLKNKGLLDLLRSQKIKRSINKVLPQKTKEKLMEQLFHKEA
ncbi:MAG: sulfotransferase, partial [Bacteroidota bacterium]